MNTDEKCFSLPALAKHFGVGRTTVHKAVARGEVPSFRVGRNYRVRLSDIPEHVATRWADGKWGANRDDLPESKMVYFLAGIAGYVKIGFTTNLRRRVLELQPGSPVRLELIACINNGSVSDEFEYHKQFHEWRVESEWFIRSPEIDAEIARLKDIENG